MNIFRIIVKVSDELEDLDRSDYFIDPADSEDFLAPGIYKSFDRLVIAYFSSECTYHGM